MPSKAKKSPTTRVTRFSTLAGTIKKGWINSRSRLGSLVTTNPFLSFISFLGVLLIIILIGNFIRKPEITSEVVPVTKTVSTFALSENPTLTVQAKIEKSGVIKLVAQTSGVVQSIKVTEGDSVNRGTTVVSLSTNYQGANAPALNTKISQKNYQFLADTYQAQLDTISLNRSLAQNTNSQQTELREIGRKSISETKSLISLNEEIVTGLNSQISQLDALNVNGSSDSAILSIKAAKAQTVAALNGLKSGLRSTEYTTSENQEPAIIAQQVRDATLKQLEIQEKALTLNKDIAGLNVRLTKISESLLYPVSPCPGVVERIHVKVGQVVNPGTLLATIKANDNTATAVVYVTPDVARGMSLYQAADFSIGSQSTSVTPRYISTEPTENGLNTALFSLPDEVAHLVTDGSYISGKISIGLSQLGEISTSYLPLDAVYQNGDSAYVYVAEKNDGGEYTVVSKKISVGKVFGSFIELVDGLTDGDEIITTRSVIPGEMVTISDN